MDAWAALLSTVAPTPASDMNMDTLWRALAASRCSQSPHANPDRDAFETSVFASAQAAAVKSLSSYSSDGSRLPCSFSRPVTLSTLASAVPSFTFRDKTKEQSYAPPAPPLKGPSAPIRPRLTPQPGLGGAPRLPSVGLPRATSPVVVDDEDATDTPPPPPSRPAFLSARDKLVRDEVENRGGGRGGAGGGGWSGGRGGRGGGLPRGGFAVPRGRSAGRGGDDDDDDMKPPPYHFGPSTSGGGGGEGSSGRKVLGGTAAKRPLNGASNSGQPPSSKPRNGGGGGGSSSEHPMSGEDVPEQLRNLEPAMIERIENEIMDKSDRVSFDDIAGLKHAKQSVVEMVIWPMKRPDLFTGLRSLPKGLLLFGPPGTGKTLIGKAIATQCGATFFSISASSLTSKWVGEGEKMVRTLFAVASVRQPAVIFIDEIDSLLQARTETDMESSRRIKTEFLVQLDGAGTKSTDLVLVIGATNRPQELDEAARRRFVKRLYIPLPDGEARLQLVRHLLSANPHSITDSDLETIVTQCAGFSGADVTSLCKEAAMGPVRHGLCGITDISAVNLDSMPPITMKDFEDAFRHVRTSVSPKELVAYEKWNAEFGSFHGPTAV